MDMQDIELEIEQQLEISRDRGMQLYVVATARTKWPYGIITV